MCSSHIFLVTVVSFSSLMRQPHQGLICAFSVRTTAQMLRTRRAFSLSGFASDVIVFEPTDQ